MKISNFEQTKLAKYLNCLLLAEQPGVRVSNPEELLNAYFVGATLCLDIKVEGSIKVLTLNHSDETMGFFDGGFRKLISIANLKRLELLHKSVGVKYKEKWL